MIISTIFRMLWVTIALMLAIGAALAVLFALGAMWVGDELRAAAPNDPMLRHGADRIFGVVLFAGTVTPALTILPALARGHRRRGAAHSLLDVLRACRRRVARRHPAAHLAAC